mgnify:CR=1 FL=1
MKFHERFVLELKSSKMSQKEIAERLNIDESNITKWKKGDHIPSLEVFYQLCVLLEVSADYLLGLTD